MAEEKWYTVEQVATLLQVHENTVRRWLRAGELAAMNLGGKAGYRIRGADLDGFIAGRYGTADPKVEPLRAAS